MPAQPARPPSPTLPGPILDPDGGDTAPAAGNTYRVPAWRPGGAAGGPGPHPARWAFRQPNAARGAAAPVWLSEVQSQAIPPAVPPRLSLEGPMELSVEFLARPGYR